MAEAAGLVLGAVALVPLASCAVGRCLQLYRSFHSFPADLEHSIESLSIRGLMFQRECRILLGFLVGLEIAEAMMNDTNHRVWKLEQFHIAWEKSFGHEINLHMNHIEQSLNSLIKLLRKVMEGQQASTTGVQVAPTFSFKAIQLLINH